MPVMTLTLVSLAVTLIVIGTPISVSLGFASILVVLVFEPVPSMVIIPQLFSEACVSFTLLAVPLFVLAGNLMERGTIGRKLIDFTTSIVGWMTGGLGAVNVVASMIFGGISGSSLADTATFGTILIPRMIEEGYPDEYSGAITMTSSCLSVIIPPSILIVLAAAATQKSASRALAAGLVPGILITLLLLIPNHYICKKHGYGIKHQFFLANVWAKFKTCWTALMAPLIVLGSIFSGMVTPTEGAGVAVLYILLIDGLVFRNLTIADIWTCIVKTAVLTGSIMLIATSSAVMNYLIAFENVPALLMSILTAVPGGKIGFLLFIVIILILIGMTVDATPAILIFAPLFMPAAERMGVDPSHFILVMITGFAVGLTTPPYGVCIFSVSAVSGIPITRLIQSAIPFYIVLALGMVLVALIPDIALLLPKMLGM